MPLSSHISVCFLTTAIKAAIIINITPNNFIKEKSSPNNTHPIITEPTNSPDAKIPAIDKSMFFPIPST